MAAQEALKNAEADAIDEIRRIQEALRVFRNRGPHKGMKRELIELKRALAKAKSRLRNLTQIKSGL